MTEHHGSHHTRPDDSGSQQLSDGSRRDFLRRAALLAGSLPAAAALTGAASARRPIRSAPFANFAAAPTTPIDPDGPLHIGVIGTGGMGRGHCHALTRFNKDNRHKVHIVAVADPWKGNLQQGYDICTKEQDGVDVEKYHDYHDLLKRDDIHGVVIASPEHWHAQMALDAIAAGKHVYLEKPMTLHLDEALNLYKVIQNNPNMIVQVGTQMMRLPRYHEARKLIRDGVIGQPTFSQTSYCRNSKSGEWNYYHVDESWQPGVDVDWEAWLGPAGPHPWDPYVLNRWRRYKKFSTGIVGDLLVHVVSPLMLAVDQGFPVRVTGSGSHLIDKAMENHDQVNINIEFETGHIMAVAGSTCNEVGLETMIRGHKGNMYLGGRHCVVRPERIWVDDVDQQTVECEDIGNDQDAHRLEWLECVRSGEQPSSSVDLGMKVMVFVDLATRSMWDGHAYTFDPKTMTAQRV